MTEKIKLDMQKTNLHEVHVLKQKILVTSFLQEP